MSEFDLSYYDDEAAGLALEIERKLVILNLDWSDPVVMRTLAMLEESVPAEPMAVRRALSGNLCRCTGYEGIVHAVVSSLRALRPPTEMP